MFDMLGFAKIGPGRWDHLERRVRKVALGLRSEPRGEGTGGPKIRKRKHGSELNDGIGEDEEGFRDVLDLVREMGNGGGP